MAGAPSQVYDVNWISCNRYIIGRHSRNNFWELLPSRSKIDLLEDNTVYSVAKDRTERFVSLLGSIERIFSGLYLKNPKTWPPTASRRSPKEISHLSRSLKSRRGRRKWGLAGAWKASLAIFNVAWAGYLVYRLIPSAIDIQEPIFKVYGAYRWLMLILELRIFTESRN